jgi:iron(III) transport system substrate-binding protein
MLERIGKIVLVALFVFVTCSFDLPANGAEPPAFAGLNGVEKARLVKLIEGAKKEGKLVGYSSDFRMDVQAEFVPKFREWYGFVEDDLKINLVSMRTDAIISKVTEELRAKIYITDVVQNSTINWFNDLVTRGELMPYDSPEYRHFGPQSVNPEIAAANPPYFIAGYFTTRNIVYNPKYVKGEISHWKDVLRPEYKGKISCADVSNSASHTEAYLQLRTVLDASFFRALAKQDPFILVSASDQVNKALTGEYPLMVMGSGSTSFRALLEKGSIKLVFPTEGWAANAGQTAIFAHAPHPNASKLFIDFLHSKPGQQIIIDDGMLVGRLGMKSKYLEYPDFPRPIYDIKGAIPVDWRKLTNKDRDNARAEFRRLVIDKK